MHRTPSGFVRKPTIAEVQIAETRAAMIADLRDATDADEETIEQAAIACLHAQVMGNGHELSTYLDQPENEPRPRLRLIKGGR